jgi:hypothetical protein
MPGGCANIVEVRNSGIFKGMWDIESRTNLYTGDNTIQHDYSLFCRWVEPQPALPVLEFCN